MGKRARRKNDAAAARVANVGRPSRTARKLRNLMKWEAELLIAKYFAQGNPPRRIKELIAKNEGAWISLEMPFRVLPDMAKRGLIRIDPSPDMEMAGELSRMYRSLKHVEVVHSNVFEGVATRASKTLVALLQERAKRSPIQHVGFSGGASLRLVARELAQELSQLQKGPLERVVFHALVSGGLDPEHLGRDPNVFFSEFLREDLFVKVDFHLLNAPPVVSRDEYAALRANHAVTSALEAAAELDVVVSSAAEREDSHSRLYAAYQKTVPDELGFLSKSGCVGDFMWLPIGERGPIDVSHHPLRAFTLLDLAELPARVKRGTDVFLALGACSECRRPKNRVLKAILSSGLVTHLVVDRSTAFPLLPAQRHKRP